MRRRGTAILETSKGILLTSMNRDGTFLLPGGGADKGESRFRAAIRELEEETGLLANYAKIIFKHNSHKTRHTVVLVKARGTPRPRQEIKKIRFYNPKKKIKISEGTRAILEKYYEWKKNKIKLTSD